MGISSALWPAVVCGRKKTGTEISCSRRRLGQRFGSFHSPTLGCCLGGHSPLSTEVFTTNTHQKKESKHLYAVMSNLLLQSWGETKPRRQTWQSHLRPTPVSSHHHHHQLVQVNKHTRIHSTSQHGRGLPPLQSALISSSVCAAEDNLEAMACSRTHCLSHTAIKCTSLSGCPVSLGQEGLSSS